MTKHIYGYGQSHLTRGSSGVRRIRSPLDNRPRLGISSGDENARILPQERATGATLARERPVRASTRVQSTMSAIETVSLNHRPHLPERRDMGIGIVGAGFIVRDCHLVAYAEAGFRVAGITSRSIDKAREVAEAARIAARL